MTVMRERGAMCIVLCVCVREGRTVGFKVLVS